MTKKKLTSAAEAKIAEVLAADDATVVELARRMGPEVLRFLDHIMRGNQAALELVQPVPLGLRLAAADLVRKYSSLPTNVDLHIKVPPQIIYVGDDDTLRQSASENRVHASLLPEPSTGGADS